MNHIKNPFGFSQKTLPNIIMAEGTCKWFFLFFLTLFTSSSSGTQVGFSYHAGGRTGTSYLDGTMSFLEQNKVPPSKIRVFVEDHEVLSNLYNRGLSVDLYLNHSQAEILVQSKSAAISWLKTHVIAFLPRVNIKSIIAISSNELPTVLSTLKSIHSVLTGFHVDRQVKVSVSFSLPFLKNLSKTHERELQKIVTYIKEIRSYVTVEASIDGELRMGDGFVESIIERAKLAASFLAYKDVPMVLTIKSSAVAGEKEVAEFTRKVSKALENNRKIRGRIAGVYADVVQTEDFAHKELEREKEQIFPSSHRELLRKLDLKTTLHDTIIPPTTTFPTTPISTTPVLSPDNPSPTIVTVPSTVTITPANPATPVAVPSTTPITIPPTAPANTPVTTPVTVPGAQPITNPVTTYPAPPGPVPVTTPVTNPVPPPATTNAPAVPGASWCVAKSGALETALQSGLDYACGMGGADCSQIQQGGSCYNPNTLQNHASYAFNSYYQKNPAPTSCDFGGTATIVNANPSTGSCIYPSSSSSSSTPSTPTPTTPSTPTPSTPSTPTPSTPSPTTPTPIPSSTTPTPTPTATTPPPSGSGITGYGTPPTVLNTSNPASGTTPDFGSEIPPGYNSSTASKSVGLRPFSGCIFLLTFFVLRKLVIDV